MLSKLDIFLNSTVGTEVYSIIQLCHIFVQNEAFAKTFSRKSIIIFWLYYKYFVIFFPLYEFLVHSENYNL